MTTCVALLRAINVAGHGKVGMEELRRLFAGAGFADPRTLMQTGNIVFGARRPSIASIERQLEAEARERLGLSTDVFIRTAPEWRAIVDGNPFAREARHDPAHLLVMCLRGAPAAHLVEKLQAGIAGREVVAAGDRHLYIVYPDGIGRSRLTGTLIEKTLETRGTARNWNTVLKLAALARA